MEKQIASLYLPHFPKLCPGGPLREQERLHKLALWAYRFSPVVAVDTATNSENSKGLESDSRFCGINLDLTGSARLFGGEKKLLHEIQKGVTEFGFTSRIALAPTLGGAWALARYRREKISLLRFSQAEQIPRQVLKEVLGELPLSALRLPQKTCQQLGEVELRRITDIFPLVAKHPRHALINRYGGELLLRVDQALGAVAEPLKPIQPRRLLKVSHVFPEPVSDREVLQAIVFRLLLQLLEQLRSQKKRTWKLTLLLEGEGTPSTSRTIPLSLASSETEFLLKLLQKQVEKIPILGAVKNVILLSERNELVDAEDLSFLSEGEDRNVEEGFLRLIDSLRSEIGRDGICRLQRLESHIPERSFHYQPVENAQLAYRAKEGEPYRNAPLERPAILLTPPERIRALAVVPDSPPFSIRMRETSYRVLSGIGPERIAPEWWQDSVVRAEGRDYFKLQLNTGTWVWVYRELRSAEWFLHGIWS